ncbi:MAG: DUF342 domain-containing protein [Candidatus Sericytochromatia bacterium]|nr:DUF342 domain-containing protein [Candidatus Sericytochromatia bacterium]
MSPEQLLNPVQIRYSEDKHFIYVTINPREVIDGQLQADQILEALLESGFSSFSYQIDQTILDELINLPWQRLNRVIVRRIAWRIEFDLKLRLAQEGTQAFVTVIPAFAQEAIGRERLLERLAQEGVSEGILGAALEQILAEGQAEDLEIARSRPPRHGKAGWLEWLFVPLHESEQPEVLPGTPLLRVHPGQPGEDGLSLDGKVLKARHGQDQSLQIGAGCAADTEDPVLIRAQVQGVPVRGPRSIAVMPLEQYGAAEIHSGQYLGCLEILGDLPPHLQLETLGHLIVRGSVKGGFLRAGGDILITGAVSGPVRLAAAGDICLPSAQEALLHAGGDVRVKDSLVQVRLYCCGQLWATEAQLAGGAFHLLRGGVCSVLGAAEGAATQLALGATAYFENQLRYLQAEQSAFKMRLQELGRRLVQSRHLLPHERARFVQQQHWLKGEQEAQKRELMALQQALEKNSPAASLHILRDVASDCELLKETGEMPLSAQSGPLKISRKAPSYVVLKPDAESDRPPADRTA